MTVVGQKLTIVHVFTHSSITRGGAVQGLVLAEKQAQEGHSVLSVFHKPSGSPIDKTLQRNFPFPVLHVDMKNPLSYLRFAGLMQDFSPQVVHCHRNLALLFAFFSLRWLARGWDPILVVNRGTIYELPNPIVKYVFRSKGLDHIIAVAEAVKRTLVKGEGIRPEKVTVIYGSYDEKRFHEGISGDRVRQEIGLSSNEKLIVCIAAVDRRKGLEYLARAVKIMVDEGLEVKCVSVGKIEDRAYYERVVDNVKRLQIGRHFSFLGHRYDIPEILAAADVSVSASVDGEGLTGALRESLAMKRPVVATDVAGNAELIRDGETGWLIPPRDSESLARALMEAVRNPEEARKRALRGFERVRNLCSQERRYQMVMDLYYRLLSDRKVS